MSIRLATHLNTGHSTEHTLDSQEVTKERTNTFFSTGESTEIEVQRAECLCSLIVGRRKATAEGKPEKEQLWKEEAEGNSVKEGKRGNKPTEPLVTKVSLRRMGLLDINDGTLGVGQSQRVGG